MIRNSAERSRFMVILGVVISIVSIAVTVISACFIIRFIMTHKEKKFSMAGDGSDAEAGLDEIPEPGFDTIQTLLDDEG